MCTLSFAHGPEEGDWSLFFNRDEARNRAPEIPPAIYAQDGVQCIAPTDSAAGGTWITANEFGLSVALLNGYVATRGIDRGDAFRTRGELVRSAGAARDLEGLTERLGAHDLTYYRPFVLFAVDRGAMPLTYFWNGERLERDEQPEMPLASSGAVQEAAKSARTELFKSTVGAFPTAAALDLFQRSHAPERGALSPCMHRDDASTRSLIRIDKDGDRIVMRHEAGAPCRHVAPTIHELALTSRARTIL